MRDWHNDDFQDELQHANHPRFTSGLWEFLAPLMERSPIDKEEHSLSQSVNIIIKHTISLWSYLHCARGHIELIEPERGDWVNTTEHHEAYDELSTSVRPWIVKDKKVLFVRCKGVRWRQEKDDSNALVLKARVLCE